MGEDIALPLIIAGLVAISIFSGKIDLPGGLVGGLMTCLLFLGAGWLGVLLIAAFFVMGTLASLWKLRKKEAMSIAEAHNVRRGWRNVVANSGVAGLLAAGAWLEPAYADTGCLLISACFAAALSDTWSSELGNVHGTKFYHVLTGKKDLRGQDGVVSVEGSLAGVAGSGVMAILYGLFYGFSYATGVVLVAGIVGNLVDSVLGATLERKGKLGNHAVNFLNTVAAALIAYFLVKNCSISS